MNEQAESPTPAADIRAFLRQYEDQLRRSLVCRAEVERGVALDGSAVEWVEVDPDAGGAHLEWFERVDESMGVEVEFGGRWELPWSIDGARQLRRIVDAVIAGRITTFSALGCSRVEVMLEDGTVLLSTRRDGLLGRLPLDLLRRRFRLVSRYDPY